MTMLQDPLQLPEALWPSNASGAPDQDRPMYMAAFKCANEQCSRLSIGWTHIYRNTAGTPKEKLAKAELEWEPVKTRRPSFDDVPAEIASTASEAHACLSIGAARGAVALARAVVEASAKAKGITDEGIVTKINALRDNGIISPLTADASHQIRRDGNSIAHGDIGDDPISEDDAEAILEFMDALLDEVFQRPAKLQRLKDRHEERKQSNG